MNNNDHDPLSALGSAFGHSERWQISPLKGGLSDTKIFIADNGTKKYVVRFFNQSILHAKIIPSEHLISFQKTAAREGYGAKVYWSDPDKGVIVMDYLLPDLASPSTTLPQSTNSKKTLNDLAILLNKIHQSPLVSDTGRIWTHMYKMIDSLKGKAEKVIDLSTLKSHLDTLVAQASAHAESKTCHRDLHPGNLVFSRGQFFAVDYDTMGVDDPYIDIAKIANFYCHTPQSHQELLTLYLHRPPTDSELSKLTTFKKILFMYSGMAFLQTLPTEFLKTKPELVPLRSYTELLGAGKASLQNPIERLRFGMILIQESMVECP